MSSIPSMRLDNEGKPVAQNTRPKINGLHPVAILKDLLGLPTILGLGCLIQAAASKTNFWYLPCLLLVLGPVATNALVHFGLIENSYKKYMIPTRTSASIPRNYRDGEANDEFAVLHLGLRINSPIGMLDPTARMMNRNFGEMIKHLTENPEETGFLNVESYLGANRASQNTIMYVFYFQSYDHILKFSGGFHMKGWKEFSALSKERQEAVEIWHEGFVVSKADAIYANVEPIGMGNMWQRNEQHKEGEEWINGFHKIGLKSGSRQRLG